MHKLKVAVIGGGAAALGSLRVLSQHKKHFAPVAFEKFPESIGVGGLWNYIPNTADNNATAIYQNLVTNLPKEIMMFRDFPFVEEPGNSFITHENVLHYLKRFARELDLDKYVKFNSTVTKVKPLPDGKWDVSYQVQDQTHAVSYNETFDAVMVCNGHYEIPKIPALDGIETFSGMIMHSSKYRVPCSFIDKTVIIVGAGNSGIDIAVEIAKVAKQIHLCHQKELQTILPTVIESHNSTLHSIIGPNIVLLENGTQLSADAILWCTGYLYDFPFLDSSIIEVVSNGGMVKPLYHELFNINYPTLSFIGLQQRVVPFPMFEAQACLVVAHLLGSYKLPSSAEMLQINNGLPARHRHEKQANDQWDYHKLLSDLSGSKPLPPYVEAIYKAASFNRKNHVTVYKNYKYKILDDDTFEEMTL